jgi:hypothetical protein
MRPGDEIIVRWLSDRSFLKDGNFVDHFRIPELVHCVGTPFDVKCRGRGAALQQARTEAAARIRDLRPRIAMRSDMYGFFQKSADILRETPPGTEHWIHVATDLEDNVRFKATPGHLEGIHVVVHGYEPSGDPAYVARERELWTRYFLENGALSVSFPSVEMIR